MVNKSVKKVHMGRRVQIELLDEAAEGVKQIGKITGRTAEEVVCDALSTYEWILQEQAFGKKVISQNGDPEGESELEKFIVDEEAAKAYFPKPA